MKSISLLAVSALLISGSLTAQATVLENQELLDSDGTWLEAFGRDVSVSGNRALVTSFADEDIGSATVFERVGDTWTASQKLVGSDSQVTDRFGVAAVIQGDEILIGCEYDDDNGFSDSGSVYVYERIGGTWQEVGKLHHADPALNDGFGRTLDVDGDVLVVGAGGKDEGEQDAGAAYVFRRVGGSWVQEQKLASPSPSFLGYFGGSVAVSGDVLVIGASSEDAIANDSGVAYVYRYDGSTWQPEQTLTASDGGSQDYFGTDLAIDGDVIAVGAYRHDGVKGAVYAYRWNGASWVEEQKLQASWSTGADWVGFSVAIDGDRIVAGAPAAPAGVGEGAAVQFHHNGSEWVEVHTWKASNPTSTGFFFPNFGFSVDIDWRTVFVGSPWADGSAENSGAAYWCHADDLAFAVDPVSPAPGQLAYFQTYGGFDGEDMGVFILDIAGIPFANWFYFGAFDGDGQQVLPLSVPAGLAGIEMSLIALGRWKPGVVGKSNIVTFTFGN